MLDGPFNSYYNSGKKKAEGKFENNQRKGTWTLWDTSGNMTMQRNYTAPFQYDEVFPKKSTSKENKSYLKYTYRSDSGYYIGFIKLNSKIILYNSKLYKLLNKKDNNILFFNKLLINNIVQLAIEGIIRLYDPSYELFHVQYNINQFNERIDTNNYNIISFKIIEELMFDTIRKIMQPVVIGICPVGCNKKTNEIEDLYWVYYPELINSFSKINLRYQTLPSYIKTLNDLFYYNYYAGEIYKEQNVYDRKISDYKKGAEVEEEANSIEARKIEWEHYLWLNWKQWPK